MDSSVDERLARAATLPAPLYTDPAVLAAEKAAAMEPPRVPER
jgi:hypothetical protein